MVCERWRTIRLDPREKRNSTGVMPSATSASEKSMRAVTRIIPSSVKNAVSNGTMP